MVGTMLYLYAPCQCVPTSTQRSLATNIMVQTLSLPLLQMHYNSLTNALTALFWIPLLSHCQCIRMPCQW